MFLGQLIQKTYKDTYVKLIVGVETGYNVNIYTLRTRNHLSVENIDVDDQVLFAGRYISKGQARQYQLHFIMKHTFRLCPECCIPLTSDLCFIKHDKEAQKLEGEWRVVHKIFRGDDFKVFFEKEHFVFAAVASPKHWYFKLFRNLKENDIVSIRGWRYKQRTSFTSIKKAHIYENIT